MSSASIQSAACCATRFSIVQIFHPTMVRCTHANTTSNLLVDDVEGMELGVLSTTFMELLSRKQIANLVIEITLTWWSQNMVHGHTTATSVNDAGTIFRQISSFGYRTVPNTPWINAHPT